MRKKQLEKWLMYHEVHKQHREGLKPAQIARELVMDRRTVRKYLAMSEEEYLYSIGIRIRVVCDENRSVVLMGKGLFDLKG